MLTCRLLIECQFQKEVREIAAVAPQIRQGLTQLRSILLMISSKTIILALS